MQNLKYSRLFPFALVLAVILLSTKALALGGSTFLNHVNNYQPGYSPNWVEAGKPIVFHVGALNNSGGPILNVRGFFEVYSPDGATWQPIDGAWNSAVNWNNYFDGGVLALEHSANGSGADTAHFNSFNLLGPGFPNLTSTVAWKITTQVDTSQIGKQICLDSVKNSRGTSWLWTTTTGSLIPTWNGPFCFAIQNDCCQNIRGDVNGDGNDGNILDLSFLVDRIFRAGPQPPCALEADLNGDGASANITDLTYIIDIIYRGGPPGVGCP